MSRVVNYPRHRSQWLEKVQEAGVRRRAERLFQQLDMLQHLRQQARRGLLAESRKHTITAKLRQVPSLGPIRFRFGGGPDPNPASFPQQAPALALFLIVISVPMLFVSILIEERKAVETELSQSRAILQENFKVTQDLASRLLNAQEEERRRIARELHDDIGQRLALVCFGLDELKGGLPAGFENANNPANSLIAEVQSIADDIHGISHQLHSSTLETLGLEATLKNLCLSIARQYHTSVQFQSVDLQELPAELKLCLFRVAQEALNNAVRHGKAKRIEVSLQRVEDILSMKIIDEGEGFDPATLSSGLGLMSMQERVRFSGGKVSVESRPGIGTQVHAELPLRKSA